MKLDWSFPKHVLVALLAISTVGGYPLLAFGSHEVINAALIGGLLATLNVLAGFVAVEYSFGKSATTFFKYVLGGMGIRMFVSAAALVVLIKVLGVHAGALVSAMGVFYVVFLGLEILYIQKKVSIKQQSR
jgi:hypothetical protein